jgi:hypothetical protein
LRIPRKIRLPLHAALQSGSHFVYLLLNAAGNGMILAGNNEDHGGPIGKVRFEPSSVKIWQDYFCIWTFYPERNE